MPTTIEAPAYLLSMTEAQFQALVMDAARLFGWVPVHFRQMVGNPSGYPDLTLFRGDRVLLVELKTEKGAVSAAQRRWHDTLAAVGTTVHVWRPSLWDAVIVPALREDAG